MFTIIKKSPILAIGSSLHISLNAYATKSPKPPLHDGCSHVPDVHAAWHVGDFVAEYIGDA